MVTGGLFIAATDSKHYQRLAPRRIFKHFPFIMSPYDLSTIHGTDERVSQDALAIAARYFGLLLLAASLPSTALAHMAVPLRNPPRP